MDEKLRKELEEILKQVEIEEQSQTLLRQALEIEIPVEDGSWLKSTFQLAATFLELAYSSKKKANQVLPWLLFSLGVAYQRHHAANHAARDS